MPVCQILPPTFPGHVAYCPYSKNPGAEWRAPRRPPAGAPRRRARFLPIGHTPGPMEEPQVSVSPEHPRTLDLRAVA